MGRLNAYFLRHDCILLPGLLSAQFLGCGPQKSTKVQLDKKSGIKAVFIPNYKLQ